MKKIRICSATIFLLLSLTVDTLAQSDTSTQREPTFKNQVDLDVHLLALEGTYKRRFSKKTFIGTSLGFGPLFRGNFQDHRFIEAIKIKGLFDYSFTRRFHVHFGVTLSRGIAYPQDRDGLLTGLELGVFYEIWKLEVGIETAFIFFEQDTKVITTSFSIIKIPLSRW